MYYIQLFIDAFDNNLMKETLESILEGKKVELPVYDFKTHTRSLYNYYHIIHSRIELHL